MTGGVAKYVLTEGPLARGVGQIALGVGNDIGPAIQAGGESPRRPTGDPFATKAKHLCPERLIDQHDNDIGELPSARHNPQRRVDKANPALSMLEVR
jgi:hypothetical protein